MQIQKSYLGSKFLPVKVPSTLPISFASTDLQSFSEMSVATFFAGKERE